MIEFIFTLDYEIYGNGGGSLRELVYEPTRQLASLFQEFDVRFVVFAEALEFEKIEQAGTDAGIADVRSQLRHLYEHGFEIGLHLHPWWANAHRHDGIWHLDWTERNLCEQPEARIDEIVGKAIAYLRTVLGDADFTPVSFRGGLWLMQPTAAMARVLAKHGIRIDSSVFKGGLTRQLGLDYRPALRNGQTWRFSDDVMTPDPDGLLLELPIHTEMVPFWKMLGAKRLSLQQKAAPAKSGTPLPRRWSDFARWRYPRKLDFCRMTAQDMSAVMKRVIAPGSHGGTALRPVVAIGHSKDLVDIHTIRHLLSYLKENTVRVTTFAQLWPTVEVQPPTL